MKKLIIVLIVFTLFGCYDRGYGPSIINSSDNEKTVFINYTSKERLKITLKKCGIILSGREFDPIKSITVDGLTYDVISVEKESNHLNVIHIFDKTVLFLKPNKCLAP